MSVLRKLSNSSKSIRLSKDNHQTDASIGVAGKVFDRAAIDTAEADDAVPTTANLPLSGRIYEENVASKHPSLSTSNPYVS